MMKYLLFIDNNNNYKSILFLSQLNRNEFDVYISATEVLPVN